MQTKRKYILYAVTGVCLAVLAVLKYVGYQETAWWYLFLLWGAMLTGFVMQPLVKSSFPGTRDSKVVREPQRHLQDHEVLMGYYAVAVLGVFIASLILSEPLLGKSIGSLFVAGNAYFWLAAITSGVLNVGIFYFFNKALRYGDLSIVVVMQSLFPIAALPISFIFYNYLGWIIPDPSVSRWGIIGIALILGAVAFSGFTQKTSKKEFPPENDWLAHHPRMSVLLSSLFAAVAVNCDKVAVSAGNPFLAGVVILGTVALVTFAWTTIRGGVARVQYVFSRYARQFLLLGFVYAGIIVVMNTTLLMGNVNYYGTVKTISLVFASFYGLYVLSEGIDIRQKFMRLLVSLVVVGGVFLIVVKG